MKYIQIRHWDYWYTVYSIGKFAGTANQAVEFSVTNDYEGEDLFFHFDFYTLPAARCMLESEEFMEKDEPDYPNLSALLDDCSRGKVEYFIGELYYSHYHPTLEECNRELSGNQTIFSITNPHVNPYYAVVFLSEEQSLLPDCLMDWIKKISKSFFKEAFDFEIANIPSLEEINKSYAQDAPFYNI